MKDSLKRLFINIPFIIGMTFLIDIGLNFQIESLNEMIVNFEPYGEEITCLGCCSLECLEYALIDIVKTKIMLPFFSVGLIVLFAIIECIGCYLEREKVQGVN